MEPQEKYRLGPISNIKLPVLQGHLLQWFTTLSLLFRPRGESLPSQRIIKDKQIYHDNHPDESKTKTQQIQ